MTNAFVPSRPAARGRSDSAFTLVELLVVIGIIAVLISVLLPTLSSARRKANAVKCAAALREVGNCYQMYGVEYKGWWPPAKLTPASGVTYTIGNFTYTATLTPFWFNFISKYAAANANVGMSVTQAGADAAAQRKTILWGCPAWEGYYNGASTSVGGTSSVQPGYGMNPFPLFTSTSNSTESNIIGTWGSPTAKQTGRWFKQVQYKNSSERCLVADSLFWECESDAVPVQATYPPSIAPQPASYNGVVFTAGISGQTVIDIYRHGTHPSVNGTGNAATYSPGGRFSFNILYCDGHVVNEVLPKQAYVADRQHFPG
jgi:prepilin-type N-terminal cleavage/methylation domain-containing protein/prepilin-type processing-associated H-X9-DG protein